LGTVGTHSYFNGFDLTLTLAVGLASLLGAVFIGYMVIPHLESFKSRAQATAASF